MQLSPAHIHHVYSCRFWRDSFSVCLHIHNFFFSSHTIGHAIITPHFKTPIDQLPPPHLICPLACRPVGHHNTNTFLHIGCPFICLSRQTHKHKRYTWGGDKSDHNTCCIFFSFFSCSLIGFQSGAPTYTVCTTHAHTVKQKCVVNLYSVRFFLPFLLFLGCWFCCTNELRSSTAISVVAFFLSRNTSFDSCPNLSWMSKCWTLRKLNRTVESDRRRRVMCCCNRLFPIKQTHTCCPSDQQIKLKNLFFIWTLFLNWLDELLSFHQLNIFYWLISRAMLSQKRNFYSIWWWIKHTQFTGCGHQTAFKLISIEDLLKV